MIKGLQGKEPKKKVKFFKALQTLLIKKKLCLPCCKTKQNNNASYQQLFVVFVDKSTACHFYIYPNRVYLVTKTI